MIFKKEMIEERETEWDKLMFHFRDIIFVWKLNTMQLITSTGQELRDTVVKYNDQYIYCSGSYDNGIGKAVNTCIKLNIPFSNIYFMYTMFDGFKTIDDPDFVQTSYYDRDINEWVLNLLGFKNIRFERVFKRCYKIERKRN